VGHRRSNLAVAEIVVEHLEALRMEFPEPTVDLKQIERKYHHAEKEEKAERKK
jgi:hypothetical protein